MKNKKKVIEWALFYAGVISLIIIFAFEEKFIESISLSIFPIFGMFKGMFGGKGYSHFWGEGNLAKQVLASGKPATATLISIAENSGGGMVTVNEQPLLNLVLMIEEGSTPPYQVSIDTIVPRTTMSQLQPGAKFAVKVDLLDKNNVVFDQNGTTNSSKSSVGGKNWTDADRLLLEQKGIEAMALMVSIDDTGRSEDYNPVVKIIYEVYIPGEAPYKVEREIPMPTQTILQLKGVIGKTFKAKVHPNDKNKISVNIVV